MKLRALLVVALLLLPCISTAVCAMPEGCSAMAMDAAQVESSPCHGVAQEFSAACCCSITSTPEAMPADRAEKPHFSVAMDQMGFLPLASDSVSDYGHDESTERVAFATDRCSLYSVLLI